MAVGHTAHGGTTMYLVNAHDAETEDGTVAWFTLDNGTEANPSPTLSPGQQVRLVLVNLGDENHTLRIGAPIDQTTGAVPPGNETILSFTVPSDPPRTITYEDPAFADRGMQASFQIATDEPTQATPGPSLAGLLALTVSAWMVPRPGRAKPPP